MNQASQTTTGRAQSLPAWLWGVVAVTVLFGLRFLLSDFQLTIASEMLIVGLFALSLNLIMGYGGMVHFGHAAFYGVGGYAAAILITHFDWSPWAALIVAPFVSAAVALVIGWFAVRRVGLYFSILTLAFGQLVYTIVFNAREITGGDDGLHGVALPEIIDSNANYYWFTLLVFILCFLIIRMVVKSPFVLILRTVRENSERAQFIGVNVRRHQLITFVIGGFFAGVAGALLLGKQHFVGVDMLYWTTSAVPILASLLGGMFMLTGPVIGAALLIFLNLTLTRYFAHWSLILGTLTVIIVLVAPTGILGLAQRIIYRTGNAE